MRIEKKEFLELEDREQEESKGKTFMRCLAIRYSKLNFSFLDIFFSEIKIYFVYSTDFFVPFIFQTQQVRVSSMQCTDSSAMHYYCLGMV